LRFLERVNKGQPVKVDPKAVGAVEVTAEDPLLKEDPTLKVGDKVFRFHLEGRISQMKTPGDRYAILQATPELAGLRKAFAAAQPPQDLADFVLQPQMGTGPFQATPWSPDTRGGRGGDAASMARTAREVYLVWHTRETPEQEPKSLADVREEAVRA